MEVASRDRYYHPLFYLLALLAILIIAYWPISFHVFSLKNDALNYFLPTRRLVSESFHKHMLPLWTPYLNLGYPLHGDMQSGVWNPVVQLLSVFGPYTLYTLQIETLIYIYLSGAGMFFLLRHFRVHPFANLMASVAYMLCGFNSDCCQYLNWIAGASFLPFVFLFYYRCLEERSVRMALYTGTSVFFLFVCAYPADFILSAYLLAAMFIWHLLKSYRQTKTNPFDKKLFGCQLMILFAFLALSAPAILSYLQSLPLTERGSGASYAHAMSNPLHPLLISSYTTPLAVWKMPYVSVTDGLERNSFMGIVGFIFLWCSFLTPSKSSVIRFSKYAVVVSFIFSLGEWGGLRILSYYFLPLMNTFRHPANAKMFTIFFSCLLAAFSFSGWIKKEIPAKIVRNAVLGVSLMAAAVLIWSLTGSDLLKTDLAGNTAHFSQYLKDRITSINFTQIVLLTSLLQLPFLYLSWRWLFQSPRPRAAVILAIVNSLVFCMLAQPFTVVKNERAATIQRLIDNNAVDGYPLPDLTKSIAANSDDGMKYFREIGVLNLYNKKPGRVDYRITPSNLLFQNIFWADTIMRKMILHYPLIYQADSALAATNIAQMKSLPAGKKYVFGVRQSLADSINSTQKQMSAIQILRFLPNNFQFRISNDSPAYYVLLQNQFPRWNIMADGKTIRSDRVNTSFMGFMLPKGDHVIDFTYAVPGLMTAWWVSVFTLVLIIFYASAISGRFRASTR